MDSWAPNPGFGKIVFLLFANSCIGSGPNRSRIRHGREYPLRKLFGFLYMMCATILREAENTFLRVSRDRGDTTFLSQDLEGSSAHRIKKKQDLAPNSP